MQSTSIIRKCQKCGRDLLPLKAGNGRTVYRCLVCKDVLYTDDEFQIEPLKKLLLELAKSGRVDQDYPKELEKAALRILEKEDNCLYARFFLKYAKKLQNLVEDYKQFLVNETYDFNKDEYNRNIVETIVKDGYEKFKDITIEHLKRVVSDPIALDGYITDFQINCSKNKKTIVLDYDIFLYCAESDFNKSKSLISRLSSNGFQVWNIYNNTQSYSQDRDNEARQVLSSAKSCIIVTSKDACENEQDKMLDVIRLARNQYIPIIEYKVGGVRLNSDITRALPDYDTAYANTTFESGIPELIDMLQRNRNRNEKSVSQQAPQEVFAQPTIVPTSGLTGLENVLRCICLNEFDQAKSIYLNMSKSESLIEYYITSFVYNLWYSFKAPPSERVSRVQEAQSNYLRIRNLFVGLISDDEKKVYQYFDDNPNNLGLLLVSYCLMKDSQRYSYLKSKVDLAYITSTLVTNQLLKILIITKDYNNLKYILSNNKSLDFVYAIKSIQAASNFSDSEKLQIMDIFAEKASFTNPKVLKKQFNDALGQAKNDSERTVYLEMMGRNNIEIDAGNLEAFNNVSAYLVYLLERNIVGRNLDSFDVDSIINFACKSKDADSIVGVLETMKNNAGVLDIGSFSIQKLILVDLDTYGRLKVLNQLMEFEFSDNSIQEIVRVFLEQNADRPQDRFSFISAIVDKCLSSNPKRYIFIKTYQNYLITNVSDGSYKIKIFEKLRQASAKFDNLMEIVNKYMTLTRDSVEIKQMIISGFAELNADMSIEACQKYLQMPVENYDSAYKNVLRQYMKKQPSASSKVLSNYIKSNVNDENYEVLNTICSSITAITKGELKEIITMSDEGKRNKILIRVLGKVSGLSEMRDTFMVSSSNLECNMLQGLLALSSLDNAELQTVIGMMKNQKCTTKDKVVFMGKKMHWDDFPVRAGLSNETKNICNKY